MTESPDETGVAVDKPQPPADAGVTDAKGGLPSTTDHPAARDDDVPKWRGRPPKPRGPFSLKAWLKTSALPWGILGLIMAVGAVVSEVLQWLWRVLT